MQTQHKDAGGQLWEQENLLQAERAGMAVPANRELVPALFAFTCEKISCFSRHWNLDTAEKSMQLEDFWISAQRFM